MGNKLGTVVMQDAWCDGGASGGGGGFRDTLTVK